MRRLLVRAGLSLAALGIAGPALAQSTASPEGPHNLFDDRESSGTIRCMVRESGGGVERVYRATFQVSGTQLGMPSDGTEIVSTAFAAPRESTLSAGVRAGKARGKPGLQASTAFRDDRVNKYSGSYTLTYAFDLPGAPSEEPLVSHVFHNGEPIWYSGLHQPKPGTTHYEINRQDRLAAGATPLQGALRFVFERGDERIAVLDFDASGLDARAFLDAKTTPILGRVYDRGVPPAGCH